MGLASYCAGVVLACGNYRITGSGNVTISPMLAMDYVLGPYAVQCLQDPQTSMFCGPLIQSYNSSGGLLVLPTSKLYSYCVLEMLNVTLSNLATYSVTIVNLLSSAMNLCGS